MATSSATMDKALQDLSTLLQRVYDAGKAEGRTEAFGDLLKLAQGATSPTGPVIAVAPKAAKTRRAPTNLMSLREAGRNWRKPRSGSDPGTKVRPSLRNRIQRSKRQHPYRIGWLQKSLMLEIGSTGIQKDALWSRIADTEGRLPQNITKSIESLLLRGLIRREHGGYILTQVGAKAAQIYKLLNNAVAAPAQAPATPETTAVA